MRALPVDGHPTIARFSRLCRELGVVLPLSFFERAGQAYYNSLAMIDADGTLLGVYRKSHIPDGPGYEEKYYFNPGDTGFRTWRTRFGTIGVAICWDQWFPEGGARHGAEGRRPAALPDRHRLGAARAPAGSTRGSRGAARCSGTP